MMSWGERAGSGEPCGELKQLCWERGEGGSDSFAPSPGWMLLLPELLALLVLLRGFCWSCCCELMVAGCCELMVNSREGSECMEGWRGELGEET